MRERLRTPAFSAAVVAAALLFTGCTGPAPEPTPSATAEPTGRPVPTADAPPVEVPDPALKPELSASENLEFFDWVNLSVIAADPNAKGRAFIDALAAGGFDRSKMQVTSDTTTLNTPADSIQFSVEFQAECLVGQYGPAAGGYHSAIRPVLGTGGCLVGSTVPVG
ncbi:DUF6993 domain-containing protein [Agromyces sp. MMS24-JH15]|uniref:DUF6993 domain-containing protein n=1 Tax=Agromyces sp. MMS24-JH15 TaxID=3243765 RepID=UPI0037485919